MSWAEGRLGGRGPVQLLFGRMYEDWAVDLEALRDCPSVLAIASAGDTALALAGAGHSVTAVDINAVQVEYVRQRMAGAPPRPGQADGLLRAGRGVLRGAGWRARRLERFCALGDPEGQAAEWRRLTGGLSGLALRCLLAPVALGAAYHPAFVEVGARLAADLPGRIGRGLAVHPNTANPWASLLFTGRWPGSAGPLARGDVRLVTADVVDHLEQVPAGTYDGFTLSNVLDGAPVGFGDRLRAGLRHAGRPGAVVVVRTLARPVAAAAATAAVRDRALIWGGLTVATVEAW